LRIFVTGGAGYIGSHLLLRLQAAGYVATTFDNLSTGNREAVLHGEFIEGDVTDIGSLATALRDCQPDAVVHLAALSDLRESLTQPVKYHQQNTIGTLNVVAACRQADINRIVFSSSAAVYGAPDRESINEDAPIQPISPYGTSKAIGETLLQDTAASSDLAYVALRFFNVAGADLDGRIGESTADAWHLIKIACQAATGKRAAVTINGGGYSTSDGTCVRDYVHVDDIARAHLDALEYLKTGAESRSLNVGYGHGASVRQVVETVKSISGVDFPVIMGEPRAGDPPTLVANSDRIRDVLGWQPKHDDLELIVRSALAWERKLK